MSRFGYFSAHKGN